jgi:hypothetical protein
MCVTECCAGDGDGDDARWAPVPAAAGAEAFLPPSALAQMRSQLAEKVVDCEQDHLVALHVLVESYLSPLLPEVVVCWCRGVLSAPLQRTSSAVSGVIGASELRGVFANVSALLRAHRHLLADVAAASRDLARLTSTLGGLLAARFPLLLALTRIYAANLPAGDVCARVCVCACSLMRVICVAKLAFSRAAVDTAFALFVQRTGEQCGQPIASLMLEPINILFVFRSLLFSWLQCTPVNESVRSALTSLLCRVLRPSFFDAQDRRAMVRVFRSVTDTLDEIHENDRQFAIFPEGWLARMAKLKS